MVPHFDKVLHVGGGVVVAWFFYRYLGNYLNSFSHFKQFLILVAMTALVGLIWEFAEYGARFIATSHPVIYQYFHGGDLKDTLGDLLADLIGGVLYAVPSINR